MVATVGIGVYTTTRLVNTRPALYRGLFRDVHYGDDCDEDFIEGMKVLCQSEERVVSLSRNVVATNTAHTTETERSNIATETLHSRSSGDEFQSIEYAEKLQKDIARSTLNGSTIRYQSICSLISYLSVVMLQILRESIDLSRDFFLSLGAPGLFAVAFLEFFLLPVPPDLVLIPLAVAQPEFAFLYASIATAGSVTAGLVGYMIGRKGGRPTVESRFAGGRIERAERYFDQYGLVTLGVGAFAPIPEGYELLSIASGALGLDLRSYLLASLVGRGGKYFLEAALVLVLGEAARSLTEVQLYSVIGIVTIGVVLAYVLRRRWVPNLWESDIE